MLEWNNVTIKPTKNKRTIIVKMKKIEIDIINGVCEVNSFDPSVKIIESKYVFDYLKEGFKGTIGTEVNQETFDDIKNIYGIKGL